jgi:hypothetical protein
MAHKKPRLTALTVEAICTRLRAGGSEMVAVQAAGVPWKSYQKWLAQASRPRAGKLYRQLAEGIDQAQAQARLLAEIAVRDSDAKAWLLHGPGRETAERPGWGAAARADASAGAGAERIEVEELCALALRVLLPFPEARALLSAALEKWDAVRMARKGQQ